MPDAQQKLKGVSDFIKSITEFLLPIVNSFLAQANLITIKPDLPIEQQYEGLQKFVTQLGIFGRAAEEDRQDIYNMLVGLVRTSVPDFDPEQHPDVKEQLNRATDAILGLYPVIYTGYPQLIQYVNPRSRLILAMGLHDAFKRFMARPPEDIVQLASRAAEIIYHNPQLMQGYTTYEISQLATHAIQNGMITDIENPDNFTKQLSNVIKLTAPIRYALMREGKQADPEILIRVAKHVQAQYPTVPADVLTINLWQQAKMTDVGGIYSAAMQWGSNEVRAIINMSGSTLEELQQKHQLLTTRAANSYLGSAAGAVIRAVREGLVSINSPAGLVFKDLMAGRPLAIDTPVQLINVLIASGLRPEVAAGMALQSAHNKYYLTPSALLSIRATQWNTDWRPRIELIYRMYPGNDPQTASLREGMISMMAQQAGYKNVYELLALHAPPVTNALVSSWNRAEEFGARAYLVSGSPESLATSYPNTFPRLLAILQQVGTGEKQPSLQTLLEVFGFFQKSPYIYPSSGLLPPREKEEQKIPGIETEPPSLLETRTQLKPPAVTEPAPPGTFEENKKQ